MKPSRSRLAGSQESDAPRRVWLDYEEFQADTPDVVGFYRRRQDAEEAAENCRRQARDDYGWVVYGDEGRRTAHEIRRMGRGRPRGSAFGAAPEWKARGGGLMRSRYNHLYALGFSVDSDDPEGATEAEVLHALWERLIELKQTGEASRRLECPTRRSTTRRLGVDTHSGSRPRSEPYYATAAANAANRSPGSGTCSRQVTDIGSSPSWLT